MTSQLSAKKKQFKLMLRQLNAYKKSEGKQLKKLKNNVEPVYNQWILMLLIKLEKENNLLLGKSTGKMLRTIADLHNKFKELRER